jgi:hypothetical protein
MNRGKQKRKPIFLLGAGASADAGMPTVAQVTNELRQRLPNLFDVNGQRRPEFGDVFDFIAAQDPYVANDYERLFEWIRLVLDGHREPFRKIINIEIRPSLIDGMAHLTYVIGGMSSRSLRSRPLPTSAPPSASMRISTDQNLGCNMPR